MRENIRIQVKSKEKFDCIKRIPATPPQLKDDIIHEAINESASAMNSDSEDESGAGGINFAPPHSQQISTLSGRTLHTRLASLLNS